MIIKNTKNNKGFAMLFAVTISAILLVIALGVSSVALKEIKFTTSAKSTNEAFYAADVGVECSLFNDKSNSESFKIDGTGIGQISCFDQKIRLDNGISPWGFSLTSLGETGQSCAKVVVTKIDHTTEEPPGPIETIINSKGYNMSGDDPNLCNPPSSSVEREIETRY